MRKRIIAAVPERGVAPEGGWLDLDSVAEVEITSENPEHPIEGALVSGAAPGWQADQPGEQTIRLCFLEPRQVDRIWLRFDEAHVERTQQFVLRWSPDHGRTFREIVRQQWNFSPLGTTEETENIAVGVSGVTMLELVIIPDISGGEARASLTKMRVG